MRDGFRFCIRLAALAAMLCALCATASAATVRGDLSERFPEKEVTRYWDVDYLPKENLTKILFLGIDTTEEKQQNKAPDSYASAGQSDFMLLMVIDEDQKLITPVQIDRDTMANIVMKTREGKELLTNQQISLAHGYGDTPEEGCELATDGVEWLFRTEVDYYISMNLDAIPVLNDAVGGVPVTVPIDLTALDPALYVGNTLTLHGDQATYFVRSRLGFGDSTNVDRMKRQRIYIKSFADIIQSRVQASANYAGELFDIMQPYLTTNMRRGAMINIAWEIKDYTRVPTITPEGEHTIGSDGFVEFHADQHALWDLEFSLFYDPVGPADSDGDA